MTVEQMVIEIQQGREELIPVLWEAVRKLIAYHARRYAEATDLSRYGVETDDLIQCGYFALLQAVKHYDPEKGAFPSYLAQWLRNQFHEATGRTERRRCDLLNRCRSLDALIDSSDPDGDSLIDTLPDPHDEPGELIEQLYTEGLHEALEEAIATLPQGEADTIRAIYWTGKPLTAIATETGSTFSEIQNTHARGLRHLRKGPTRTRLEKFIDERTPFYRYGSLHRFQQTHTSVVEELAIRREGLEERYGGYISKEE